MLSLILFSSLTLLVFAAVCAVSDYLTGKIPNSLILCGLSCAVISRFALLFAGSPAQLFAQPAAQHAGPFFARLLLMLGDMAAGCLIPFAILIVPVCLRMLGGGDLKLLCVIGLQLGAGGSLRVVWYSFLAAAAESAVIVLRRRNLHARLAYLRGYIRDVAAAGRALPYREGARGGAFRSFPGQASDVRAAAEENGSAGENGSAAENGSAGGNGSAAENGRAGGKRSAGENDGEFAFAVPVWTALAAYLLIHL